MGIIVSAAEAGALVGRHERMVRWHITAKRDLPATKGRRGEWRIDTDDLARIPGWVVDRELLAKLEGRQSRGYSGLVARTEAMEAHIRALESQLARMERQMQELARLRRPPNGPPDPPSEPSDPSDGPETPPDAATGPTAPPDGFSGASLHPDWLSGPEQAVSASSESFPLAYRGPATVTLLDRGPDAPQTFATTADAARWLGRHGVNPSTCKTWDGWRHVQLEPRAVLAFALTLQRAAQRAQNWRVRWRLTRCDDGRCVCQEVLVG